MKQARLFCVGIDYGFFYRDVVNHIGFAVESLRRIFMEFWKRLCTSYDNFRVRCPCVWFTLKRLRVDDIVTSRCNGDGISIARCPSRIDIRI